MFNPGPTDRYEPRPGTAACPYCAHVVAGVGVPAATDFATFRFICPACGEQWSEIRDRGVAAVLRFYERAAVAAEVARG